MSYSYLGSPYSSTDPVIRNNRYLEACHVTAAMLKQNLIVFSPIVHCHMLAEMYDLPTDFTFWEHYCLGMLRQASEIVVLRLDGWEQSIGLRQEVSYAHANSIPVRSIAAKDY
jgi:hypothetical protein